MTMVVVGASLAGAKAAQALREGYAGRIVLVGSEDELPYERPPLSKEYLQGKAKRDKVFVHPAEWYPEHDVELRLGTTVTAIDRRRRVVVLADGEEIEYDELLLATGASPRRLPIPGGDAPNLDYLRTLSDSDRLKAALVPGSEMLIVGAGWIGLEAAAAAREAGVEVTVVEAFELPLLRVLGPEVAERFATLHREHGVDLRLGVTLEEFILDSRGFATGVRLADGSSIDGDTILVAVGAAPNTGLAEDAGLEVDNGVVVDAGLRSGSDPHVFAAGDVARAWHPFYEEAIRVEHWANALNQPAVAAASMLGAADAEYTRLPYFYTDQYDLGMEYTGYVPSTGYDEVVFRGDTDAHPGEYIAFWLAGGRVLAGMNVNVWDVTDDIKALIQSRAVVDPLRLADVSVPLADLLPST
jgi:3-phenylpropionate/trans-cinnamate dioxygenase ferredoxin reductase subunit